MFQLYLVAGTYAFQCCHLCIRRGAQNDPETASWRLGGTGDVLLVARWLHHIVALIHYHLYNTADILLSYFIRHCCRRRHRNNDDTAAAANNRDDSEAEDVLVIQSPQKRSNQSLQSFFLYNDFVCLSNNKWLRIFIPCR